MKTAPATIANLVHAAIESLEAHSLQVADDSPSPLSPLSIGLSSQEIYALVCFLRHERRQEWVRHVVESRLQANGAELVQAGAFAHPEEISQSGDVPGEKGWRYFFHGRGCCFTHKDGTAVDVDFADDGTALDIDPYFYTSFLESSPSLGFCEAQLKKLKGLENGWQVVLPQLSQSELIQRDWRFRLSESGRATASALEPLVDFIDDSSGAQRFAALALIGDFFNAEAEALRTGQSVTEFAVLAKSQLEKRVAELRTVVWGTDDSSARFALASLAGLGKVQAMDDVLRALRNQPVGGLNHTALAALRLWESPDVTRALINALRLFTRQSLTERVRHFIVQASPASQNERATNGIITGIAAALFGKLTPAELKAAAGAELNRAMRRNCKACDDDAGFFLYLLDVDAGLAKLRANLANPVPITRQGAACYLALIGTGASEQILVQASRGHVNAGGHEAACALSLMDSDSARTAALEWLRRNDGYEDAEGKETDFYGRKVRTWSMDEMMRSNLREHLRYSYEKKCAEFAPLLQLWCKSPVQP